MKRTEWYPIAIKPVREGWYELGFKIKNTVQMHTYMFPYHYWDGVCFRGPSRLPVGNALTVVSYLDEYDYWRGVMK